MGGKTGVERNLVNLRSWIPFRHCTKKLVKNVILGKKCFFLSAKIYLNLPNFTVPFQPGIKKWTKLFLK